MSLMLNPQSLGLCAAFGSSVTWAIGSSVYAKLSREYSGFAINFTRALISLPVFLMFSVFILFQSGLDPLLQFQPANLFWLTLSMIASYLVGDILFYQSTRALGTPGALAIASSYPLWNAVVSMAEGKESISWLRLLGLLVTFSGMVMVILNDPAHVGPSHLGKASAQANRSLGLGFTLGLLTSFFWALNSDAVSRGAHGVSSCIANAFRMGMALGLVSAVSRLKISPLLAGSRGSTMLILPFKEIKRWLWAFLTETVGGSFFFVYGLTHSALSQGPILTSLAPVLSVPVALAVGSEKFSILRTLGICLVVSGVALLVGR